MVTPERLPGPRGRAMARPRGRGGPGAITRRRARGAGMPDKQGRPRLVIGISGASGAIYGARLLDLLRPLRVETHLVMSRSARTTLALETDLNPADLRARADVVYGIGD